jgi:phage major head subunit gpT-like protein
MPTPINSEHFSRILEPGLRAVFMLQREAVIAASPLARFFNVVTSNRSFEQMQGVGGMGDVPAYNGTIAYDSFNLGYQSTFTHVEYALGIQVERKLVDDDLYNVINQRASMLGMSFGRTREKNAASLFNNAFSASYLGSDGKALCATDHPYSAYNATAQGNKGTSALTHDTLIATRKLMRAFKDDRGELVTVMPDTLVVPPQLEDTAQVILNSINKSGTANNDVNVNKGGYNLVVWDYLTDSNNWFLCDSAMMKQHCWWFTRVPVEFALDPSGDYDLVARYRGYERYSFGFTDWRCCYGHEVT